MHPSLHHLHRIRGISHCIAYYMNRILVQGLHARIIDLMILWKGGLHLLHCRLESEIVALDDQIVMLQFLVKSG